MLSGGGIKLSDYIRVNESKHGISCGINKLDSSLSGGRGFKDEGFYDISSVIGGYGVGHWDILMQLIVNRLKLELKKNYTERRKILVLQNVDKIPWFKLQRHLSESDSAQELLDMIDIVSIEKLSEIFVLFNLYQEHQLLDKYCLVVIDSFHYLYSQNLSQIQHLLRHSGEHSVNQPVQSRTVSPTTKFYQSIKCLFHLFKGIIYKYHLMVVTTGKLDIYNQKVLTFPKNKEIDADEDDDQAQQSSHFYQKIMVPVISLNNDLSLYYTDRVIIYRDWVLDSPQYGTLSGLSTLVRPNGVEDSFRLLEAGSIYCMPHYLCIGSKQFNKDHFVSGWFGVGKERPIIDLEPCPIHSASAFPLQVEIEKNEQNREHRQSSPHEIPDSQC